MLTLRLEYRRAPSGCDCAQNAPQRPIPERAIQRLRCIERESEFAVDCPAWQRYIEVSLLARAPGLSAALYVTQGGKGAADDWIGPSFLTQSEGMAV